MIHPPQERPSSVNFLTLLDLSGLKKKEFAKMIGMSSQSITNWKCAAPTYAVRYLQLYLEVIGQREEIRKASSMIGDYLEMKDKFKQLKTIVDSLNGVMKP